MTTNTSNYAPVVFDANLKHKANSYKYDHIKSIISKKLNTYTPNINSSDSLKNQYYQHIQQLILQMEFCWKNRKKKTVPRGVLIEFYLVEILARVNMALNNPNDFDNIEQLYILSEEMRLHPDYLIDVVDGEIAGLLHLISLIAFIALISIYCTTNLAIPPLFLVTIGLILLELSPLPLYIYPLSNSDTQLVRSDVDKFITHSKSMFFSSQISVGNDEEEYEDKCGITMLPLASELII